MDSPKKSFTGITRKRTTSPKVKIADTAARLLITIGGIGTIVAVLLVCFELLTVAFPLASSPWLGKPSEVDSIARDGQPWRVALDDNQLLGWTLERSGTLHVFRADTGQTIETRKLLGDETPTAISVSPDGDYSVAFGMADGTIRFAKLGFKSEFVDAAAVAEVTKDQRGDQLVSYGGGLLQRLDAEHFRLVTPDIQLEPAIKAAAQSPIVLIDHLVQGGSPKFCTYSADGKARLLSTTVRQNLMTGKNTFNVSTGELPAPPGIGDAPKFIKLAGRGDTVYLAWEDGRAVQYDTRNLAKPEVVTELDFTPENNTKLTALHFVLGRGTLLVGDSTGRLSAWFRAIDPVDAHATGAVARLVEARVLRAKGAPITTLANSARNRVVAAGAQDGSIEVYFVTSGQRLLSVGPGPKSEPVAALALAPKADGLFAITPSGARRWIVDLKHFDVSFGTLFLPVWYEGYASPKNIWQSTAGSDDVEPKFGFMPLVFGTLKATFYSMIIGVPLSLLAAIFSNAYLSAGVRARVKPTIELMASLPSVVLGFIAAMVIAPWIEDRATAVLCSLVTVPWALLMGAHLWQMLPRKVALQYARWRLMLMLLVAVPAGLEAALLIAPTVESWLFAGDIKRWLDGQIGSGQGAWIFLLVPAYAFAAFYFSRDVNNYLRMRTADWRHQRLAVLDLGKFLTGAVLVIVAAWATSVMLSQMGFDPRGTFVGTYDQRNSLVVGFVMGFAIIPIIFTIADDALTAVPESLRSASLGAGATQWQTVVHVVVPTAMSGLFSAVMIGLGRAVGETMIVLMGSGNTPTLSWNVFQGLRTLSANIAVELPEAVKDGTHFRLLYLQALILFAITFVLNSVAETIRQRFRKRAYEL